MNSKDALREFEEMWTPKKRGKGPSTFPQHLHNLISEHYYPKEFIVFCNDNFYWDKGLDGYLPTTVKHQGMIFKTTDELLTYWEGIK